MEYTPREHAVKTIEMTKKDLEYYLTGVDKAVAGLTGLPPILKEVLLHIKSYQTASHATEKAFTKGGIDGGGKLHCCLFLRSCHSHPPPQPSAATILISQEPSTSRQDPSPAKRL